MRLVLVGCEYTGKTTLVAEVVRWLESSMGGRGGVHDHFTIPSIAHRELSDEEREQVLALSPALKEEFQRYMIAYHLQPSFYRMPDHIMVGFHIEEAVYGPFYWGYGREGEYSERTGLARSVERELLTIAPEAVLVLLRASPEVIADRMTRTPHPHGPVQQKDIGHILAAFEEQYESSLIRNKFALDTSEATVEQTLGQFVEQVEPFLTDTDRLRMLTRRLPPAR